MFFFCFCLELNLDKSHCNSRQCTYWHPWHLLTTPFTIPLFAPTLVILIPSLSHSVTEQFDSKYIITASDTGNLWDHLDKKIFFDFVLVGQVSHLQCITNCASHAMLKPACITCVHHPRCITFSDASLIHPPSSYLISLSYILFKRHRRNVTSHHSFSLLSLFQLLKLFTR